MALVIRKAIHERGLEVREIAKRMGISPATLSRHINGNPSVDILNRIADAIGCKIIDLFDDERPEEQPKNEFVCPKCGTRMVVQEK